MAQYGTGGPICPGGSYDALPGVWKRHCGRRHVCLRNDSERRDQAGRDHDRGGRDCFCVDACPRSLTGAHGHTGRNAEADSDAHGKAHCNAEADSDANATPDTDANANADADANPYADTTTPDTNADTDAATPDTDANANTDADTNPCADTNAYPYAATNANTYTYTIHQLAGGYRYRMDPRYDLTVHSSASQGRIRASTGMRPWLSGWRERHLMSKESCEAAESAERGFANGAK